MTFERQRKLKQHLFLSEEWLSLDVTQRLLFLALGWYVDDHGRERVNVSLLNGHVFPLNEEVTPSIIEEALLQLDDSRLLFIYLSGGKSYMQITVWNDWWSVDRPQPSRFPLPDAAALASHSRAAREPLVAEEGERAGVGESPAPSSRPSPFCNDHPAGTEDDCRYCGLQRLRHEQWSHERSERVRRQFDEEEL